MDTAVLHTDGCPTFEFAPVTGTVLLANTRKVLNPSASGDGLDVGNLTDDFEVHSVLYYQRLTQGTSQRILAVDEMEPPWQAAKGFD